MAQVVDLTTRPLPSKRRLKRQRDDMIRVLASLDDEALDDLYRRGSEPTGHDGYPGGSSTGGGQPEFSDPVRELATRRAHPAYQPPADPVLDALEDLCRRVGRAHSQLTGAHKQHQSVMATEDAAKEREKSVQVCDACERTVQGSDTDRLRTGFCWSCYSAWQRYISAHQATNTRTMAERRSFIKKRRTYLQQVEANERETKRRNGKGKRAG